MRNSDVRESRPWEWIWLVAEGRSRGKNMTTTESWWAYTTGGSYAKIRDLPEQNC